MEDSPMLDPITLRERSTLLQQTSGMIRRISGQQSINLNGQIVESAIGRIWDMVLYLGQVNYRYTNVQIIVLQITTSFGGNRPKNGSTFLMGRPKMKIYIATYWKINKPLFQLPP